MPSFNEKVYSVVKRIPRGRVATYGQVAALVGSPRAARQVGWAMHAMDQLPPVPPLVKEGTKGGYPWWRVINAKGHISTTCETHTYEMQRQFLEKDGLEVNWDEGMKMYRVELDRFLWKPHIKT